VDRRGSSRDDDGGGCGSDGAYDEKTEILEGIATVKKAI